MKIKKSKPPNTKIRYNIVTTIVYIAGIILLAVVVPMFDIYSTII